MDQALEISAFDGNDTVGLLNCWESALPFDAVTLEQLETKVLLDENYERDSLLIARVGEQIAGFLVWFVLNKPIEKVGFREDTGFITAFGVAPPFRGHGVGAALLARCEQLLKDRGRSIVVIAPYTPNYFVPGVDKDRYSYAIHFLQEQEFKEYSEALAADALIGTFELTEKVRAKERALATQGITIRHYQREDLAGYLQFQRDHMPGPWVEDARRNLRELAAGRYPEDAIWLAIDEKAAGAPCIVGFCQHEHEHFGPFGVADEYQNKGIGTVLLARTLYQMRKKGCHSAWVLWTGQRALEGVYTRLGFSLSRRFAIMKKELK